MAVLERIQRMAQHAQQVFLRKKTPRQEDGKPIGVGPAETGDYKSFYHYWGRYPRDMPTFSFYTIQMMLMDPTVRLGLAMRAAPLYGIEWGWKDGEEWTPGIQSDNPEVATFVERQLRRIWDDLDSILTAQTWGWSGGEVVLRMSGAGQVEVDRLLPRHANDVRARTHEGELCGVRVLRCSDKTMGFVDLEFPKGWLHAHAPQDGRFYGESVLLGCYSPWWDKWMDGGALDVRRLFMHKDAFAGADLTYPEGTQYIPGKGDVPNRDIARELVEQIVAGGVTARPASFDAAGNEVWKLTRAVVANNPGHILQYPKDLDTEMLRGMGIPDDVLTAESTGAWAGKMVPMAAFYSGLDCWARSLVRDIDNQVIKPLVAINYGEGQEYQVTHKPLAEQAMEQQASNQGAKNQQGQDPGAGGEISDLFGGGRQQPPGGNPDQSGGNRSDPNRDPATRMSLAVGRGVVGAAELVKAAQRVIRMRAGDFDKSEHPRDSDGEFVEKETSGTSKPKKSKEEKQTEADAKFEESLKFKTKEDADAFRRARTDGIAIPPAWTDVVYHGKDKDVRAEGRDAKGRKQRAENPAYRERISRENNERISRDLWPKFGEITSQLHADAKAGNEEARVLYLISQTGFRIGGEGDGKAKEKAYGASTLLGNHVTVDGDAVRFDFPGKKGVRQQHEIHDPLLASIMRDAKPGKPVFKTKDTKVRAAWQQKYGGYKVHDIRHVIARKEAETKLRELIPPAPKTEKDRKKIVSEVATAASRTLGNNPSEALATYIDPHVFDSLKVAA